MKTRFIPALCKLGLAATAMAAFSVPASAQDYEDEGIVVVGTYERVPSDAQSLSQKVSYADLDLSTGWGWDEFRHRVHLTARFLCDKLGEPRVESPPASTCSTAAERDAMRRFGTSKQNRAPRGTAWVAGPAWVAPYPADWHE
jgi:UrcA family protein